MRVNNQALILKGIRKFSRERHCKQKTNLEIKMGHLMPHFPDNYIILDEKFTYIPPSNSLIRTALTKRLL